MTPEHIKSQVRTAKAHLEQCIDLLEDIEELELELRDTCDLIIEADEHLYEILTQEEEPDSLND